MHEAAISSSAARPAIQMIEADYDVIANLALSIERRSPELSKLLLDEINRAEIHAADDLPADVVGIGSEVEFLDVESGEKRRVQLVLPAEADIAAGRVSILSPVGAGLIGLRTGQSIDWPSPGGRMRELRILDATRPVAKTQGNPSE
jgi:regulator of nucleoside diphosphate kinase